MKITPQTREDIAGALDPMQDAMAPFARTVGRLLGRQRSFPRTGAAFGVSENILPAECSG